MKIKLTTLFALGLTLLSSCNKENDALEVSDTTVQFATAITRASSTTWGASDALGVFMMPKDNLVGTNDLATNVELATSNGMDFASATPIFYPQSGAVDFVAYYPYRAGVTNTYSVDVLTQSDPTKIDLLYARTANKTKSANPVALQFNHVMSRMVLNIKPGTGMVDADLAGMSVKITGMPTKSDFGLTWGVFGTPTTVADITPIVATTTLGYAATFTAIVIPQALNAWTGRKIIFTVGAANFTYAIPNGDGFSPYYNYPYEIKVNRTGISVSRGDITDWGMENSETGAATMQ